MAKNTQESTGVQYSPSAFLSGTPSDKFNHAQLDDAIRSIRDAETAIILCLPPEQKLAYIERCLAGMNRAFSPDAARPTQVTSLLSTGNPDGLLKVVRKMCKKLGIDLCEDGEEFFAGKTLDVAWAELKETIRTGDVQSSANLFVLELFKALGEENTSWEALYDKYEAAEGGERAAALLTVSVRDKLRAELQENS